MAKAAVLTAQKLVQFDPTMLVAIDEWRRGQADLPSQSEAIRRLIELGLQSAKKSKK